MYAIPIACICVVSVCLSARAALVTNAVATVFYRCNTGKIDDSETSRTLQGAIAGRGVYAMRDFEIGDAIIQYDGKDLGGEHDEDIEGKKRGKRHLLAVNGRVLDGKWHVAGAINSAIAMHGNNV